MINYWCYGDIRNHYINTPVHLTVKYIKAITADSAVPLFYQVISKLIIEVIKSDIGGLCKRLQKDSYVDQNSTTTTYKSKLLGRYLASTVTCDGWLHKILFTLHLGTCHHKIMLHSSFSLRLLCNTCFSLYHTHRPAAMYIKVYRDCNKCD